jgi:hypothetical protein
MDEDEAFEMMQVCDVDACRFDTCPEFTFSCCFSTLLVSPHPVFLPTHIFQCNVEDQRNDPSTSPEIQRRIMQEIMSAT